MDAKIIQRKKHSWEFKDLPLSQKGLGLIAGVYLLCKNEQVLYIGSSCNIRKRLSAHFAKSRSSVYHHKREVNNIILVPFNNRSLADRLEVSLIRRIVPLLNKSPRDIYKRNDKDSSKEISRELMDLELNNLILHVEEVASFYKKELHSSLVFEKLSFFGERKHSDQKRVASKYCNKLWAYQAILNLYSDMATFTDHWDTQIESFKTQLTLSEHLTERELDQMQQNRMHQAVLSEFFLWDSNKSRFSRQYNVYLTQKCSPLTNDRNDTATPIRANSLADRR